MKREIGVEAAMEGWALRDPEAARQTYERLAKERPALREKLLLGLLAGWVHSAQEGLDGYIAGLPPGAADTATSIAVGALLRKGGVDATLAWAGGIVRDETRDDELKRSVFRRATRAVARSDPERAAAWALEHAGSGWASDGPRLVVEQWGARDGPAALRWVHDHVSGEARPQATREAFAEWLRADPAGAKVWLESESLTEFHDPVLDVYASRLDDRAPQEAIGWCERIVDAERERGCLQAAAIEWYRRDPVAAEAWLQQSPLDEAARHVARRPAPLRQQRGRGALRPRPPADAPQSR
jgi:hypothetical protein